MRARRPTGFWRQWIGLFFLGGATNVLGQNQTANEDIRWLRGRITEVSAGVELESDKEQRHVKGSSDQVNQESFYVVPAMGLALKGSIYHPNLFEFDLRGLGGVGWQENSINVPNGGTKSDAMYLLRYQLNASLLREKPYAASFFAERDHSIRDYDFFTRATVDQVSQGARVGYNDGPVPVSLSFRHVIEDVSNNSRPSSLDENTLTFSAFNERSAESRTDLSYTFDDYDRSETGAYDQTGTSHSVNLNDHTAFGRKDWMKLYSSLAYNQLDNSTTTPGRKGATDRFNQYFTDHEHLNWKHSSQLQSDYNYGYNMQDSGGTSSDGHSASAALRHQLYESLTSAFDVHSQLTSSSGSGSGFDSTRYGIGLNENYTKRMGTWGQTTLGYSGLLDHEKQDTFGQTLIIVGEPHELNDNTITFLNQPRVSVSTIQVWNPAGTILYRNLLDYLIITHGDRTEIKRTVGGQIPNNSAVKVDYTAASQSSDSYSTLANQFQLRFDFFNGLLGLYGRLNLQDNSGGSSLVLEDITDQIVGMDLNWRGFRAGAEYEVYDSNLSPYRAARLFQNFTVEPNSITTCSLDIGESWSTFPDSTRDLSVYYGIARVRVQLTTAFAVNTEGGLRFQYGEGYDQQLATARANIEYRSGKLLVQAGYEYENETYIQELRLRNYFFVRLKRTF
jgi:hypothetical protein